MKTFRFAIFFSCMSAALLLVSVTGSAQTTVSKPAPVPTLSWWTVVNNGDLVPNDSRNFNSYNQPSVNMYDLVVFRGRSKGGTSGEPAHGIFLRNMANVLAQKDAPIEVLFDRNTAVPQPNNIPIPNGDGLMTFTEPPSFPRIDMRSNTVASRGGHAPVWAYQYLDDSGVLQDTRAGTTGIYTNPFGSLITGEDNLGSVPEFNFFRVPEITSSDLKFDVFPGAPAVTNGNMIVFKGNYSVPDPKDPTGATTLSKTGVYYRILTNNPIGNGLAPAGGNASVMLIANTDTKIPSTTVTFGSTAPPSAVDKTAVFAGFDNEDAPTLGGIYLAPLSGLQQPPQLTPLVKIGQHVPGQADPKATFNKIGEAVSFDGRFLAFWGAWGKEVKELILQCPSDGNKARVAYCKQLYGDGTNPGSVSNGFHTTVPVNQGIFIRDIKTDMFIPVATTTSGEFSDFVYWNFSGKVPPPEQGGPTPEEIAAVGGSGSGEGGDSAEGGEDDGEPARWRSASFVAASGLVENQTKFTSPYIAFKARNGSVENGVYQNPTDGIYLRMVKSNGAVTSFPTAVVQTGMDGTLFDPKAVYVGTDETTGEALPPVNLPVTTMGIERDGFRGNTLVINIGMANADAGWAGIYLTKVPSLASISK